MWIFLHKMASPPHFYNLAGRLIPWFALIGIILCVYGTVGGLFIAPIDAEMNDGYRIIFVHVPAAYLSMLAYMVMAVAAGIGLIWRMKLAHAVAASAAPLGAWFTFLALVTGSIWGKPMWGTWWEWADPRMTSELIMLFLYFGYMALRAAIDDTGKADKASAVLAMVGAVNIPIIHFSVEWFNSLHQGATIIRSGGPAIGMAMLYPLLAMIFGFSFLFGALLLVRVRAEVLRRERRSNWVQRLVMSEEETA
jgi:heme exporter protein C